MNTYTKIEQEYEGWDKYLIKNYIGTTTYYLYLSVSETEIYVELSSGKKRKQSKVFYEKKEKSDGGIKAILWAVQAMLTFQKGQNKKIVVYPSDSRRRRIYKRLLNYGFQICKDTHYGLCYIRKPEK